MSQKTGVAPMYSTTFAVETQVKPGTMTSSPGFNPERGDGDMKRRRARARCDRMVGAGEGTKLLLELCDEWALHDPAGLEGALDCLELLRSEERHRDRDPRLCDLGVARGHYDVWETSSPSPRSRS